MANKVTLKIRVKLADAKWHFLEPAFTPAGRLKPHSALVDGRSVGPSTILRPATISDFVPLELGASVGRMSAMTLKWLSVNKSRERLRWN